jgi:hypothetical protein
LYETIDGVGRNGYDVGEREEDEEREDEEEEEEEEKVGEGEAEEDEVEGGAVVGGVGCRSGSNSLAVLANLAHSCRNCD